VFKGAKMILKKLEDGVVISAVEIISFEVQIDEGKATINVVLNDTNNTEVAYHQNPGDHFFYQIVDNDNDILRIIHQ
jgi:hypothetical protein